ncbi:MAG: hypothetical protein WC795_02450 [Candidatus Paceibacterota bacterium]|jgi:hypothetical protein
MTKTNSSASGSLEVLEAKNLPWYDTKEGILKSLNSLSDLNKLISERHKAGYERKETLNEFNILGAYHLNRSGNCGTIQERWIIKNKISYFPKVMETKEFLSYIKEYVPAIEGVSVNFSNLMPSERIICPVCKTGWHINNCHDVVRRHDHKEFPLSNFIGKNLAYVKENFSIRTDAYYFIQDDITIHNKRFIDLTPKYPEPKNDYERRVVKNEIGWIGKNDGADDNYVIQDGDEGLFNVFTYLHRDCNRHDLAVPEEEKFRDLFTKSSFKQIEMLMIPNQYCGCEKCGPWFKVKTEFGTIKIGWRKRVINIDWKEMPTGIFTPDDDMNSLFKSENVTKDDDCIHAWGWENAQDYLTRIYDLFKKHWK